MKRGIGSARTMYLKGAVFVACLVPLLALVWRALTGGLSANPIDNITDVTGTWTLRFVMITLAVTPLRRLTGWNALIQLRRMLGLFAFFYGCLHFSTYVVLDHFFDLDAIVADIAKRPYVTVGFTGFVLMIPLALTSTAGWIRRLGGRNWQRLHRLIYFTGIAGVVHYLWLVKADTTRPLRYAAILAVLLGLRMIWALQKRLRPAPAGRSGVQRPASTAITGPPRSSVESN
jgi:sulfoxide reductase heme-binding subunit YedZ